MGFGGEWEQNGPSCDKPEVRFTAGRDRSFKLRVKTRCEGSVYDTAFRGTWRIAGDRIVLILPNQGKQATSADEATCGLEASGDEEAMRCALRTTSSTIGSVARSPATCTASSAIAATSMTSSRRSLSSRSAASIDFAAT